MRLILITTKLNLETAGGSVVDLHLKAKSLVDLGHTVTVVTAFSENNRPAQGLPYRLSEEFKPSRKFFAIQKSGYEILKKYQRDADAFYIDGHVFCYGAGMYRLLGGKVPVVGFFNIKLTGWFDAHPERRTLSPLRQLKARVRAIFEQRILIFLARKMDAYIFTTPQVAELYHAHGFPRSQTYIIPDFADGGSHIPVPKRQLHTPLRFFASGRMIKEKGFEFLLRSFALVAGSAHLTISGDGPESENLKALSQELGIAERVAFPGWVARDELYKVMDESDVFIFPRWTIEYSSVLLIEAMMRHMPSVVPRGGGIEWLAAGSAVTFTDNDTESLAKAMCMYLEDKTLCLRNSEKALSAAKNYKSSTLGKKLASVCSEVNL